MHFFSIHISLLCLRSTHQKTFFPNCAEVKHEGFSDLVQIRSPRHRHAPVEALCRGALVSELLKKHEYVFGGVLVHIKHGIFAEGPDSLHFQGLPRALFYCMRGSLLVELTGDDITATLLAVNVQINTNVSQRVCLVIT